MSNALCNWRASLPPLKNPWSEAPAQWKSPVSMKQRSRLLQSSNIGCRSIRAMATRPRDSLDHLQRASQSQKQPQLPKRKATAAVTPIVLFDRFPTARTVQQMMDTMERMIEDPLAYSRVPPSDNGSSYSRGRTPWEIKEGKSEYKMRFDMPGMTKEDVKVWLEEKMLVIKAEKVPNKKTEEQEDVDEEEEEEEGWSAKSYGKYSSRIALPEKVQFEKIRAEVRDGVLYITIPKDDSTGKILDINVQ